MKLLRQRTPKSPMVAYRGPWVFWFGLILALLMVVNGGSLLRLGVALALQVISGAVARCVFASEPLHSSLLRLCICRPPEAPSDEGCWFCCCSYPPPGSGAPQVWSHLP